MIKAILFDADDTLYQIKSDSAYEALYAFLEKSLSLPQEKIRAAHRIQIEKVKISRDPEKRHYGFALTWALEHLGAPNSEALVGQALDCFWDEIVANLSWEPDILDTVSALKKKYRLAIASDEFPENVERKLNKIFGNWPEFFEFLITPRETGEMKPSTLYYQLALKKLELKPSEVLVAGDSLERDIKPAQAWGCHTLLISQKSLDAPVKRAGTLRELLSCLSKNDLY